MFQFFFHEQHKQAGRSCNDRHKKLIYTSFSPQINLLSIFYE